MSDKVCCCTWTELGPELVQTKTNEVESLIKTKELPRSIFAAVIRVLNTMANYCPSCGACLNPELKPQAKQHQAALREVENQVTEQPSLAPVRKRCAACAGKGILGRDQNKVDIRCMKCHGAGTFESKHIAEDPRAKKAQSKVDDLRTTTGIGDDLVNVVDSE